MSKCPFELPVEPEKLRYNYEKFIDMLILSESILGGHISHHIKNNSPLCDKCKINIRDAVSRITKTLAEAEK